MSCFCTKQRANACFETETNANRVCSACFRTFTIHSPPNLLWCCVRQAPNPLRNYGVMKSNLVSVPVAADYFNVHRCTMYRWSRKEGFPRHLRGRNVGVSLSAVGQWLSFVYPTQLKKKRANVASFVRKEPNEA